MNLLLRGTCRCLLLVFAFVLPPIDAPSQQLVAQENNDAPPNGIPGDLAKIHVPDGFTAERIYDVPNEQGSWVSVAVAGDGTLVTSDQYGSFYRVTLPTPTSPISVTRLQIELGMAQGMLFAFDSLYAVVNDEHRENIKTNKATGSGLYRARDLDGDGAYEDIQRLIELDGSGEHGPHAVIPSPDGKWLYICAGNMTKLPKLTRSLVPQCWQEDILIDRIWDPRGHAVGIMAPGGWICRVSPDGSQRELVAIGFRNEYDIAFNRHGQLFTFDADMEWDLGTAWYRPTRILHVIPGVDFGWRGGSGKWPEYQIDTLPAVVNVGPGSPTGIVFGDAARFPVDYQRALFAGDWSHGKIYAIHMRPNGVSYHGRVETFASAAALPVTDIVVHPGDGAMYFTTGGRQLTSHLYRVRFTGKLPTGSSDDTNPEEMPSTLIPTTTPVEPSLDQVSDLWSYLSDSDRFVRYAARTKLELIPHQRWQSKALAESNNTASLESTVALIRHASADQLQPIIKRLNGLEWGSLGQRNRLALLRAYSLVFLRLGPVDKTETELVARRLGAHFPSHDPIVNRELSRLLAFMSADGFVSTAIRQLRQEPTPAEKSHYLLALSMSGSAFSDQELSEYFEQLILTKRQGGGKSYGGYMDAIAQRVIEHLSDQQRDHVAKLIDELSQINEDSIASSRNAPLVKNWTAQQLTALTSLPIDNRDTAKGRLAFQKANCVTCHRIGDQGGVQGPDLTTVGARLSSIDVMASVAEPNRVISDQYAQYEFELQNGKIVRGRIVDLSGDRWMIATDMMNPGLRETVMIRDVTAVRRMKVSLMPEGLLNVLTEAEILDLLAFLAQQK